MSELVPIDVIEMMPNQPRRTYDEKVIKELSRVISREGFRGSIICWRPAPDRVQIISGHQRFLAAKLAGMKEIPCDIYDDIDEAQAYKLAVLLNEKRKDLSLLELAQSWERLRDEYGYDEKTIARDFDVSLSTVYNTLSILNQPIYIRRGVEEGTLTLGDVLQLKRLPEGPFKRELARRVMRGMVAKSKLGKIINSKLREAPSEEFASVDVNMFDNIDVIICADMMYRPPMCCYAKSLGFLIGVNTGHYPIDSPLACKNHGIDFIDNPFKKYNHEKHMEVVKKLKPKYATVRDYMSKEDCEREKIDYYNLDTILDWANELSKYAENVIVIPKEDVFEQIPQKYIVGYPTSTSYGFTKIPFKRYTSHRIHLLGGSPQRQYAFYKQAPEKIVSCDSNYIHKISTKIQTLDHKKNLFPVGEKYQLVLAYNMHLMRSFMRGEVKL